MDHDDYSEIWGAAAPRLYSGLSPAQKAFMDSITEPSPLLDDAVRYITAPEDRPLARVLPFRRRR